MPTIALVRIASEFDGTQADSPRHRLCSERRPHDGMLPPQAGIGIRRGLPPESCVGHERPSPSSVCFSPHAEDERFNFSHPRPKPASFGRFRPPAPGVRLPQSFQALPESTPRADSRPTSLAALIPYGLHGPSAATPIPRGLPGALSGNARHVRARGRQFLAFAGVDLPSYIAYVVHRRRSATRDA